LGSIIFSASKSVRAGLDFSAGLSGQAGARLNLTIREGWQWRSVSNDLKSDESADLKASGLFIDFKVFLIRICHA